jgi:hypothetical protein
MISAVDVPVWPGQDQPTLDQQQTSGGAVNPTLTAMANALRAGDHLLERLGARKSASAAQPGTGPGGRMCSLPEPREGSPIFVRRHMARATSGTACSPTDL